MMPAFDVEDTIPGDRSRKSFGKLYFNHITVNKLCFRNFPLGNFKHLLRLVNSDYAETFLNYMFRDGISGTASQVENTGSCRQTFKNSIYVAENSVDIRLASYVGVPLLRDMVIGIVGHSDGDDADILIWRLVQNREQ